MYTLIRNAGVRTALVAEGPWLTLSFLIAEFFYKFHSFALECGAFLVTWFALSSTAAWAWRLVMRRSKVQA